MLHTISIKGKVTPTGAMQLKSSIGYEERVKTVGYIFKVKFEFEITDQQWETKDYLRREYIVSLEDVTGLSFCEAFQAAADKALTQGCLNRMRLDTKYGRFEENVRENIRASLSRHILASA